MDGREVIPVGDKTQRLSGRGNTSHWKNIYPKEYQGKNFVIFIIKLMRNKLAEYKFE